MNVNKSILFPVLLLLIMFLSPLHSQENYQISFTGKLADFQGEAISNEVFNLSVQLIRESAYEILYEMRTSAFTDEEGWFAYTISEFSPFLLEDSLILHPLRIKMEILPNEDTRWIKEGEGFMVTYTLKAFRVNMDDSFIMTRMEGSTLEKHIEDHLCAFKDQDPFGYLLGGFLLTDQAPLSKESLSNLKEWLSPENPDTDGGASRGVKGGFPAGRYHHKK